MKAPRFSMATSGIAILILAINLAVARVALFGPDSESESWSIFTLCLLPMIDILLVGSFRLRRRECRTAGACGFLFAGLAGTFVVLSLCLVAPEAAWGIFDANITAVFHALTRAFGDAVMQGGAMSLIIGFGLELAFPMMFFCAPPLAVACFGGWLGKRLGTVMPRARAQTA